MLLACLSVLPLFCSPGQHKVFNALGRRDTEGEGGASEGSAALLLQGPWGCRQWRDSCVKPDVSRSISFPQCLACLSERQTGMSEGCMLGP